MSYPDMPSEPDWTELRTQTDKSDRATKDDGLPVDRRTVLQSVGAASLLGVGLGSASADQHDGEPPMVRGSVEQVVVTGAVSGATVTLYDGEGAMVAEGTANADYGTFLFDDVEPAEGYTVTQTVDGTETSMSDPVRVLPVDYTPPQELYDSQDLEEGYGYLEMRDGTELAFQVAFPDAEVHGEPPYPVIIDYSGYEPSVNLWDGIRERFNERGYAVAGVNKRGTGCSGGKFDFGEPLQWLDGYDMVEAIAAQDWADGVGLAGKSYPGYMQLYVAATNPPSLDAIAPGHAVGDFYRDVGYPGGMLNSTFAAVWASERDAESQAYGENGNVDTRVAEGDEICDQNQHLRPFNPGLRQTMEATPFYTGIFENRAPWNLVADIEAPTMLVATWQDEQTGSRSTRLLERFDDETPVRYIGTNGDHGEYYGEDVFADISRFFSYHLKGEVPEGDEGPFEDALAAYQEEDPIQIYWEMSQDREPAAGSTHSSWPPADVDTWDLYFQPDGSLAESPPEETGQSASTYQFVSTPSLSQLIPRDDQGRLQWSEDPHTEYAAFVSEELTENRVCLGSGLVELWLRSSAEDTDLQVTLTEVRPDGTEMFVQNGWLRASHRAEDPERNLPRRPWQTHKEADQEMLPSGEFSNMRVELFPFGHVFRAGSRIKIAVDNPGGTRDQWGFDVVDQEATNEVAHTEAMPSKLSLPLLTETEAPVTELPECGTVRNQPCRPIDVDQLVGTATFTINSVEPTEASVGPGDTVDLSAEIENTGDARGTKEVQVRVSGIPFLTQTVTIDAGATQTVTFEDLEPASQLGPGEYEPTIWTADSEVGMTLTILPEDGGGDDDGTGDDGAGDDDGTGDDGTGDGDGTGDDGAGDGDDGDGDNGDGSGPGFGVPAAIASLGGAGYLLKRRLGTVDDEQEE